MPKSVNSDWSQPYLLPPDLREWVPEDDLAHFVLDAVDRVPMRPFKVSKRGKGSAQCHLRTMPVLPIYSYANGDIRFPADRAGDVPRRWDSVRCGEPASGPRYDPQAPPGASIYACIVEILWSRQAVH